MTNKNKERGKYPTLNIAVVYIREVVKSNNYPIILTNTSFSFRVAILNYLEAI